MGAIVAPSKGQNQPCTLFLNFEWWEHRQWCYWAGGNLCAFLSDGLATLLKLLSIELIASGDAKSIKVNYINFIFPFWISDFCSWLLGLNVDSASVNMRVHQGLGKLVRDSGPWLSLVRCFNHWVKLTIKHSFVNSSFEEISKLLTELYFLYQKSLKRHQNISRSIEKNCLDCIA